MQQANHRSGFVNIVGNPNVGKSTLMNRLVGEKISIITEKSQTTRHRIIGIVNTPEYQVVYSDTPGVLQPNYKLQEQMLGFSLSALQDADVLLYVTDMVEKVDKNDMNNLGHLNIWGAYKVTMDFGNYLNENYNLKDHRNDKSYKQWNIDYIKSEVAAYVDTNKSK